MLRNTLRTAAAGATFAAASWASSPVLAANAVEHLAEPWTHQPFPLVLPSESKAGTTMHLAGISVRCMLNWCHVPIARAYAFAVYVDDACLQELGRADQADAAESMLALKAARPDAATITVVLKMARDIDGEHLAHGFYNSVLARAKGGRGDPGVLAASRAFADQFKGMRLARGDEVHFTWQRDGSVTTLVEGSAPARPFKVDLPSVAEAIFAVYAGPDAVSADGRAALQRNLRDMVAAAKLGSDPALAVKARYGADRA